MIVGVVADTHGYLDRRLVAAFGGVDAIVHAGDVGSAYVLDGLRRIAPLYAVSGNNDVPLGGLGLPGSLNIELGDVWLHVVHELRYATPPDGTQVVVFGHSHRQVNEWRNDILYLNPGAAGRRGFHSLQTAALLHIDSAAPRAEAVVLGPRLRQAPAGSG